MMRLFALGLCLLLAACSQPDHSNNIRFALAQAPLNLDPRYASDAASERINRLIYQPLVDFDEHSRPIGDLADWQVLGPTHYRFTLKPGRAPFHNGKPVTAADVAATYQSLLAVRNSPHTAEFSNVSNIAAVDENTVDFTLKAPDEEFPARLILGILPADLISRNHDFAHDPIGSGPLRFVSWDSVVRLQRLSDKQEFVLTEVRDPTVRVLKLLRGEADLIQGDLPPELVRYLQKQSGVNVKFSPGTNFSYLGFNMQDPQLRNALVRQAVAHAINREAVIRYALIEGSREAETILPPEHWAGNPDLTGYEYNPKLARSLLQQAGVKLPLKLVYKTSTDAQRVRLATILQAQMRPAGIELEILSLDWGTFFDDVKHGKFQLYGLTWVGIKTPEIYRLAFGSTSVPPAGANRGQFSDSRVDAMIDKADWQGVTSRVHKLLPYVPLWYEGQFAAMRKGLTGYAPQPDGKWDDLATIKRSQ
ncbi:MAG TPA: ABC transporter substrate-binding protein [Methylophilaceae bacterium]|nr:ABC transporter substrate-binding protein [Methylophilaceae bacterium]